MRHSTRLFLACVLIGVWSGGRSALAQSPAAPEPPAPQASSAAQLTAAIDKLGDLDYTTRTNASRTIRRTAPAGAVAALLEAVSEHPDGYVRDRALVLLTSFN